MLILYTFFSLSSQALLLRVNINSKLIRKIQLTEHSESVKLLRDVLQKKVGLKGDSSIQYEDPDFANAPFNLMDMSELPA